MWQTFQPIFKFSKNYKPFQKHKTDIQKFVDDFTHQIEQEYQLKTQKSTRKPQLYLDQLYKMRDKMTYEEMREDISTFIIGGFDTSGKVIPGALLLLAMNPEVQEKLVAELKTIFTSEKDEVDEEKLTKMKYLDLVIKESLRLFPAALMFARAVKSDIKMSKISNRNLRVNLLMITF